jgi:hypothetical protein
MWLRKVLARDTPITLFVSQGVIRKEDFENTSNLRTDIGDPIPFLPILIPVVAAL